ncbi:MAG: hypothetical protein Q8L48_06270 [Archangium sp.]|nr:hypothetical protein [Archangium sp.]
MGSSFLRREIAVPRWLRSYRNWVLAVLVSTAGTIAWSVPAWVAAQNESRRKEQEEELALLHEHAARHQEIVKRLWATPFFSQQPGGTDASDLLNPAVPWEAAPPRFASMEEFRASLGRPRTDPVHALSLPPELDRAFSQPWDAGIPAELLELDLGWMDDLQGRGTWNIYVDSPALQTDDFSVRLPKFMTLDRWGRAALAQGITTGGVAEASRRVRHLAWLELTTGNEVAVASALSLISREQRTLAGLPGFTPIEPASADDAAKAVAFERSIAVYCADGCPGMSRTTLPPVLECATRNTAAWDLSLIRWFNGLDAPAIPATEGCHFEDVRFLQRFHAEHPAGAGPLPSVSLATVSVTLPSRVALGAMLARVFLPWVGIRYRTSGVATRSARMTLERPPR